MSNTSIVAVILIILIGVILGRLWWDSVKSLKEISERPLYKDPLRELTAELIVVSIIMTVGLGIVLWRHWDKIDQWWSGPSGL